jgi:hypothetical protein
MRRGGPSPSGAGHTTDTGVPVATSKLTAEASESPSPHADAPKPGHTAMASSNLKPLPYFRQHREDRLVGAFAGLDPPAALGGHQAPNGCADLPFSKDNVSSPHHTRAPTATGSTQDELVFGTGDWAKGETSVSKA